MSRRRALMAQDTEYPWIDTGFDLDGFTKGSGMGMTYNSTKKTLRLYTASQGTYRGAYKSFAWEAGYEYLVEYDLKYVSGTHRGALCEGSTAYTPNSGNLTADAHVRFVFSRQDKQIDNFHFYVTWSTSSAGDCTISNFSIKKRRVTS